jgi:hypothetical protein
MEYFNNLGQLPLDEPMGYGISYLGIKPTAVGVVPMQPIQVQPIAAPVMPQPIKMPKAPAPVAPKPMQQPMGIMPQPISKPMQQTFTPSPNIVKEPANPAQIVPPAPQITGPIMPDFQSFKTPYNSIQEDYNQMQSVQALPQSLQPISAVKPFQPPKPKFNQLGSLLNKGIRK